MFRHRARRTLQVYVGGAVVILFAQGTGVIMTSMDEREALSSRLVSEDCVSL